jgi:hypothetical protein
MRHSFGFKKVKTGFKMLECGGRVQPFFHFVDEYFVTFLRADFSEQVQTSISFPSDGVEHCI